MNSDMNSLPSKSSSGASLSHRLLYLIIHREKHSVYRRRNGKMAILNVQDAGLVVYCSCTRKPELTRALGRLHHYCANVQCQHQQIQMKCVGLIAMK